MTIAATAVGSKAAAGLSQNSVCSLDPSAALKLTQRFHFNNFDTYEIYFHPGSRAVLSVPAEVHAVVSTEQLAMLGHLLVACIGRNT